MELTLKQIRQLLQEILINWTFKSEQITFSNGQIGYRLHNLSQTRYIIKTLFELKLFITITEALQSSIIFTSASDTMELQSNEGSKIITQLSSLKTLSSNFFEVLLTTVPEESTNSINIKLPDVNDFKELSVVAKDIHTALSQVLFNDDINGEARIVSVENGSIWVNVFVGATALGVVASLAWAAAVIHKKYLEGKLLEQQIRGLRVKNDSLEDIMKAQKAETDMLIQAEAEHINSEHFKLNQPETIERIKNSIKIFSELINKGAEIHPALVAPEQVSNLFPDPKNIIGIESKIKKLPISNN